MRFGKRCFGLWIRGGLWECRRERRPARLWIATNVNVSEFTQVIEVRRPLVPSESKLSLAHRPWRW